MLLVFPRKGAKTMEATLVLVLVLTILVGGMMLALVMGYRSIEEGRSQLAVELRAEAGRAADAIAIPSFFAWVDDRKTPLPTIAFDDALLARLEKHVRAEQAVVTQFVHFPSIDSLYRHSDSSLRAH